MAFTPPTHRTLSESLLEEPAEVRLVGEADAQSYLA
jgi:hypothetical protein